MLCSNKLLLVFLFCGCTAAINHLLLRDDGRIAPKIDSPFYMREADNLLEFLSQIKINDRIEIEYLKLLEQRKQIVDYLRFSVQFGEELMEQAKCAMQHYMLEKKLSYLNFSPEQLQQLQLPQNTKQHQQQQLQQEAEPYCDPNAKAVVELIAKCEMLCFKQLDSMQPHVRQSLNIEAEDFNISSSGSNVQHLNAPYLQHLAVQLLQKQPKSWRAYTISSYYWRMRGNAANALQCALLGVQLAPSKFKDTALHSLGIILMRAGRLEDAFQVLMEAVNLKPHVAQNNVGLATTLALLHNFNLSLEFFEQAEMQDPSILPRTQLMRNFITCLDNLNKKTSKMYNYVEFMKSELKKFKQQKQHISRQHEKLIQQQVPLSARISDLKFNNEEMLKRGQYCSSRTISNSKKPVLYCDFYSDMQMRLESNDVDIESLERDLRKTSEAVISQVSMHYSRDLNIERFKSSTVFADILKEQEEYAQATVKMARRKSQDM